MFNDSFFLPFFLAAPQKTLSSRAKPNVSYTCPGLSVSNVSKTFVAIAAIILWITLLDIPPHP